MEDTSADRLAINDGFFVQLYVILAHAILTWSPLQRWLKQHDAVVFLPGRRCIKATAFTSLAEAHAMRFVAEKTNIPVPNVYSAFQFRDRVYILMERLEGESLSNSWLDRSEESKFRILQSLKSFVAQLRSLVPPPGMGVANVTGGPIFDQRLPKQSSWGPFKSVHDFHKELRNGVELQEGTSDLSPDLQQLLDFHGQPWDGPVFSHCDLSSFNIVVKGDEITGIIDWECAGWMPPYWEYTSAWNVSPLNRFWQPAVDQFLEPWPYALKMEHIRRQYFGDT